MNRALRDYLEAQARWTEGARSFIYRKIGIRNLGKILDAGCGAGAVTAEIASRSGGKVTGVDSEAEAIGLAKKALPDARFIAADLMKADLELASFGAVLCHFFLMWQKDAEAAVRRMAALARKGGFVAAMAEPDYGGLILHPDIPGYRDLLARSLEAEGADPFTGGKLFSLFRKAGLETETGISSLPWTAAAMAETFDARWSMLSAQSPAVEETRRIMRLEKRRIESGDCLFFLPVFWAVGRKA